MRLRTTPISEATACVKPWTTEPPGVCIRVDFSLLAERIKQGRNRESISSTTRTKLCGDETGTVGCACVPSKREKSSLWQIANKRSDSEERKSQRDNRLIKSCLVLIIRLPASTNPLFLPTISRDYRPAVLSGCCIGSPRQHHVA